MTVNIYDNANEMANVLKQTQEYTAWQKAFDDIQNNEEAKNLFGKFQEVQVAVQKMMQVQQQPNPEQEKNGILLQLKCKKRTNYSTFNS